MRILITGATGFVGGHLAEALLARGGGELHGLSRKAEWPPEWAHLAGRVRLHAIDLIAAPGLDGLLAEVQPDWVVHLAAFAHVGQSFKAADQAWATNLGATRRLYDAIAS